MGEWVVLELNPRGERDDPVLVQAAISRALHTEVFVPAIVTQIGEDKVIHYLMDGYAFARYDRPQSDYFRLEGSRYVQAVLARPGSRRALSTVNDADILRMRDQIRRQVDQNIGVGDIVKVTSGAYRNMQAVVYEEIPEEGKVQVMIKLRSKESLITLPRSFLVVVEQAQASSLGNRLNSLAEWAEDVRPILTWDMSLDPLIQRLQAYQQVTSWLSRGSITYDVLSFEKTFPKQLKSLSAKHQELVKVSRWLTQGKRLFSFVGAYQSRWDLAESRATINSKFAELDQVEGFLTRIRCLWEGLDQIADRLQGQETSVTQNIIVDGHNLAFRCFYAPGVSALTDSQGRPTGVVMGFLRSLGSLMKRFPGASLYVVWDGSSRRRKAQFGAYKANRSQAAPVDSFQLIKEILPLLGVKQAWNPEEEADDVIATLVRTPELKDQNNVIYSMDKDLLQLVTPTTSVLVPPIGSRNEVMYDPDMVDRVMGVRPDIVVQLRALCGDTSDNIPGVPRVPKKILRSLVQSHGSIDSIYRSGLAGLTKGQYERLRSAEPQVRINAKLMVLETVPVSWIPTDTDPDSAARKLRDLEINESVLRSFFSSPE